MQLDELFTRASKLPVMPNIMQKLLSSINKQDVELTELSHEISLDHSLSASVLKMANSALFKGMNNMDSVDAAVVRLGLDKIRSIVITAGLNNMLPHQEGFNQQAYWAQSIYVASLSKAYAQAAKLNPDIAFTCGMMHNIGELMIATAVPEELAIIELNASQGMSRIDSQREVLGLNYAEIGAELAVRWQFSPLIIAAIQQQLNPMEHKVISAEAVMIRLAIFSYRALDAGLPAEQVLERLPVKEFAELKLEANSELVEALTVAFEQAQQVAAQPIT